MLSRIALIFLCVLLAAIVAGYFFYFGIALEYPLSVKPSEWALVGSFFGGVLGPILSFISIILLIKSLNFQKKTNLTLETEVVRSKKLDHLKTFESLYFNLIDSQKKTFDLITLNLKNLKTDKQYTVCGAAAVIELEVIIDELKSSHGTRFDISNAIESLDTSDQIYSQTRIFNNITKLISERLTLEYGFEESIVASYYKTLVNLTDFNNLKLIAICMKYSKTKVKDELVNNDNLLNTFAVFGFKDYYDKI